MAKTRVKLWKIVPSGKLLEMYLTSPSCGMLLGTRANRLSDYLVEPCHRLHYIPRTITIKRAGREYKCMGVMLISNSKTEAMVGG
jgi:hypothetical protein